MKKLMRKKLALMLSNLKKKRPFYTELEYLESTGTQWIDTEYIGNSNTKVEVKCYSENTSQNRALFGARDGGAYLYSFTIWQVANSKIRFDYSADVSYTLRTIDWDPVIAHTIVKCRWG